MHKYAFFYLYKYWEESSRISQNLIFWIYMRLIPLCSVRLTSVMKYQLYHYLVLDTELHFYSNNINMFVGLELCRTPSIKASNFRFRQWFNFPKSARMYSIFPNSVEKLGGFPCSSTQDPPLTSANQLECTFIIPRHNM